MVTETMRRGAVLLACASMTACTTYATFDAGRARAIAVGQSQEQVRASMGGPEHMMKTLEHPKRCVERWLYGDTRREALLVDFDDQGRVCDVGFSHP